MALNVSKFISSTKPVFFVRCMSTKSNYDYQYLQNSKVPTMHFQKSLPRLPVPKLEDTCQRYLAAQRPILNETQYEKTKNNVDRFKAAEGDVLQNLLLKKDKQNKHTSYISEPWFDMYLSDRISLPINYNPVMIFQNFEKAAYNDQLIKTTNMLVSSLRFMKSLRKNILEPEVFHLNAAKSDTKFFRQVTSLLPSSISWYGAYMFNAYPLDMSQYHKLFNSTRIPMIGKDQLYQDVSARHVLVMRNGHFYTFDVLDESGNILPPDMLMARLKFILDDNIPPADVPLGVLTSENRDVWAEARKHIKALDNEQFFRKVDSALFNIVLDDTVLGLDKTDITRFFLHADGKNRWFDKSFSLIISKDGVAGVNFEHSWGDGVAVLRYFQDIYHDSIKNPHVHPYTSAANCDNKVQKLSFNTDERAKNYVNDAIKKYASVCDSLDVNFFILDGIGKNVCKKHSLSPDSIMQLGFQAAFYKENKEFVPSYESCSTAAFKHGRTETIRPCTMETTNYSKKSVDNNISNSELLTMIKNCSNVHKTLTKDAAMGQGFDRHLYALKLTSKENGFSKVPVFEDPAYAAINKNIISSSTLSSAAIQGGGFGPVVPNGYGIAYMIMDNQLGMLVTNYKNHRDGSNFIKCLQSSYEKMRDILNKTN